MYPLITNTWVADDFKHQRKAYRHVCQCFGYEIDQNDIVIGDKFFSLLLTTQLEHFFRPILRGYRNIAAAAFTRTIRSNRYIYIVEY